MYSHRRTLEEPTSFVVKGRGGMGVEVVVVVVVVVVNYFRAAVVVWAK